VKECGWAAVEKTSVRDNSKKAAAEQVGGSGKTRSKWLELGVGLFNGHGLGDGTAADATGAGLHADNLAGLQLVADLLQIGHEATLGLDVGMADIVAGLGTFSTYIANLGHGDLLGIVPESFGLFLITVAGQSVRSMRRERFFTELKGKWQGFFS